MTQEKRDFDKLASQWDENPARLAVGASIADAIVREAAPSSTMDVMDFGAGTGIVSLLLAPRVRTLCAVDSSAGMLSQLQKKLPLLGIDNVQAQRVDLEAGERLPADFDLIVSSMTLHHVADLVPLFTAFWGALRAGGRVALADLEREDGSFHGDNHGVLHFGFERSHVEDALRAAGFVELRFADATKISRPQPDGSSRDYPVFLAMGRKVLVEGR